MLRALALFVLVLYAAPAAAQEYQSKELAEAATAYRQELIDRIPANKRQPSLIARLRSDADAEYRAKRYAQAIDDLSKAIAYGADDGLVWLRLAQNLVAADNDRASVAAYNAYARSADPVERGNALLLIGRQGLECIQVLERALVPFGILPSFLLQRAAAWRHRGRGCFGR